MIRQKKYIPIIKTGEAEIRALNNIDEYVKNFILPLFELTRGRKTKNAQNGSIEKNITFLKKNFKDTSFILDITGDEDLKNPEIEELHSNDDNYKNWVDFCNEQKKEFSLFYPVVQIEEETDYDSYIDKLYNQVVNLSNNFDYVVFRSQVGIETRDLITDLKVLIDRATSSRLSIQNKIIYVLDCKYINNLEKNVDMVSTFANALLRLGIYNIILSSTSFPANVSEYMNTNSKYTTFSIKEIELYNKVKKRVNNPLLNLIYSDYASVNPIRNDTVFARGWIPRIDVPALDGMIHCLRQRRDKSANYADTYTVVANEVVVQKYFKEMFSENIRCWGMQEIINAANKNVSGSSPRFWISVRVNIYLKLMEQKLFGFTNLKIAGQ